MLLLAVSILLITICPTSNGEVSVGSAMIKGSCYRKEKLDVVAYHVKGGIPLPVRRDVGQCVQGESTKSVCVPYETTKRRLFMMSSVVVEMETIQKCQSASSSCQQLPHMVTFYKGTEYETTVDVGMCSGVCIENNACLATMKKTKSISSPNGVKCLDTVEECSCVVPHCYRLSSFEGFPEQYTDSRGNTAMRTKIIDLGRCIGDTCPLETTNSRY